LYTTTTTTTTVFLAGGNNSYTSTDKINKNKMYINETTQKHCTNNKNRLNTSRRITKTPAQLSKYPHITKHTHTHNHTLKHTHTHTTTHEATS
jgi:outer membrane lipoprotein-sorting protein